MNFTVTLATTLILLPWTSHAADRIGNGGGVYACQNTTGQVFDLLFVDTFEAEREYFLTLPEITTTPLEAVQAQKAWIRAFVPNADKINERIAYVENHITWIEDVLTEIPDRNESVTPHPNYCPQGTWTPVQLANFTDDARVLVRRELFESPFMSNVERTALYLHEGVYSYLRSAFGDTNSRRARVIVGVLLARLPDSEKAARISAVLEHVTPPPPPPPDAGYICGLRPNSDRPLYIFEAVTSAKATEGVVAACKDGENPFKNMPFPGAGGAGGGMGMPDIPGMPGEIGPQRECKAQKVFCEQVTTSEKKKTCTITDTFSKKTYTGFGRTTLEAQSEVIKQCLAYGGMEHECYSTDELVCQ